MYKNILIPISFDNEKKTQIACEVAQALSSSDTKFTLINVIEHLPSYVSQYLPKDTLKKSWEERQPEIDKLAAQFSNGVGVLVEGHAGATILDYASEIKADCIVIASHRPEMQDYLLGSTAAQVVRHADCSVMVIR